MQAFEFEATPYQHTIRIPDEVPDGVSIRVLLLVDEKKTKKAPYSGKSHWKSLLAAMPNVGSDEDFERSPDYGRDITWDS